MWDEMYTPEEISKEIGNKRFNVSRVLDIGSPVIVEPIFIMQPMLIVYNMIIQANLEALDILYSNRDRGRTIPPFNYFKKSELQWKWNELYVLISKKPENDVNTYSWLTFYFRDKQEAFRFYNQKKIASLPILGSTIKQDIYLVCKNCNQKTFIKLVLNKCFNKKCNLYYRHS